MKLKICTRCKEEKDLSCFFRSGNQKSGIPKIRGDCKSCASKDTSAWRLKNRSHYNSYMGEWRTKNPDKIRAIDIKRRYDLSAEDYNKMVEAQSNSCKICFKKPKGKRPLAIDHCHKTGKVRGLLCYNCNRIITLLDNQDLLEKTNAYLASFLGQ